MSAAGETPSSTQVRRGLSALATALWSNVIPALLAGLVLKYLVPAPGHGLAGVVARLARGFPVPFGAGLFLVFAAIAHHWRSALPLGRPALPAAVPAARRREAIRVGAVLALGTCAILALRAAVVVPYQVVSSSMLPTLEAGDRVVGRKIAYAPPGPLPAAGEIVSFRSSAVQRGGREPLPSVLVKRVVGLPGDRVAMLNGVPVINGWTVPICNVGAYSYLMPDGSGSLLQGMLSVEFLADHTYLILRAPGMPPFEGTYVVQPGEVFVLGDNRTNSIDSRTYRRGQGGGVPLSAIEARVDRFLAGTDHGSGGADLSRLLRPVDALEGDLNAEALSLKALRGGVAECLERRPGVTRPPAPGEPSAGEGATGPGPT